MLSHNCLIFDFDDQFIDLCILLGCDYCESIRGIGPKKAIDLIRKHRNLENILKNLDSTKYPSPENWMYAEARKLFLEPEVADPDSFEVSLLRKYRYNDDW